MNILRSVRQSGAFYCLVCLIGVVIVYSLFKREFRTADNYITILRQASVLLILSTGLTAVLLTGGMDLSVGSTAAFAGCVCAQFLKAGVPWIFILPVAMILGAAVGAVNAFLVAVVGLPSFVATYATNWVMRGLSIIVMSGAVIYGLPEGFTWFGVGYVGAIPVIVIIAAVMVAVAYVLLQRTTWGRDIYAYGSNPEAALYSAMNLNKTVFSAFMMCSMTAAVGGLLMTARLNAAEVAMGDAYGLQTVAAVVVGGTSMLGGEGGVAGTVVGAILLTVIVNVMNLEGIPSTAQPLVVGVVIVAMVLVDAAGRFKAERVSIKSLAH